MRAESPLLPIPFLEPCRCPEPSAGTGRDTVTIPSAWTRCPRHLCATKHLQREGFPGNRKRPCVPHPHLRQVRAILGQSPRFEYAPPTHTHRGIHLMPKRCGKWAGKGTAPQVRPRFKPRGQAPHLDEEEGSADGTGRAWAVRDSGLSLPEECSMHYFFLLPVV